MKDKLLFKLYVGINGLFIGISTTEILHRRKIKKIPKETWIKGQNGYHVYFSELTEFCEVTVKNEKKDFLQTRLFNKFQYNSIDHGFHCILQPWDKRIPRFSWLNKKLK